MNRLFEGLDSQQKEIAIWTLIHPDKSLYLTGQAGSGKSFLIKFFLIYYIYLYEDIDSVIICAPTNLAADNIGGITFHSLFGLGKDDILPNNAITHFNELPNIKKEVLETMKVLIIDEISLLKSCHLDFANNVITELSNSSKKTDESEYKKYSFGGIRLFAVGDHCQLPPIVTKKEHLTFFFQSQTFITMDMCVAYLSGCHRNRGKFNEFLNLVRNQSEKITDALLNEMNNEMYKHHSNNDCRTQLYNLMVISHNELRNQYLKRNQTYFIIKDRQGEIPNSPTVVKIEGPEFIIATQNNQCESILSVLDKRNTVNKVKKIN
jgi:hypothetical protein